MKSPILHPSRCICVSAILALAVLVSSQAAAGIDTGPKQKKAKRAAISSATAASKERVQVTGSHIPKAVTKGQEAAGASPVYVITQERIRRLGVTSVSAALRRTGFGR